MALMPINHKYTLLCDEVRQENNGKFLIIGMYTPDIVLATLPTVMPLTFFSVFDADRIGHFALTMKLQHAESGSTLVEARGGLIVQRPGMTVVNARLPNIMFQAAGPYQFIMTIEGEAEPIIAQFQVMLGIRQPLPNQPR